MDDIKELENAKSEDKNVAYKIAMLGDSGVGKTALTYQFTTSEYICAYDLSLDDDYGQKTVSVLLNNQETDLEVIDHPACEMSVSAAPFLLLMNVCQKSVQIEIFNRRNLHKTLAHMNN